MNKRLINLRLWTLINWTILTFGFYLRFHKFACRGFTPDEFEQLRAVREYPLKDLLTTYLPLAPGGFPGDYLLTWVAAQVTSNKWILVAPHIIATAFAFWLFLKIRRENQGYALGTVVGLLMMAMNRNLIFHDFEFRPYGVLPALALLSYWAADRMFGLEKLTRKAAILWMLLVFTFLLFHAYGILILGSLLVFQTLKSIPLTPSNRERIGNIAGVTLLASALALPLWLFFARAPLAFHDPFAYCRRSVTGVTAFFLGSLGDWGWRFSWIPGALLMASSCFLVRKKCWRVHLLFILFLLLIPLGAIFVSDVRCHYWFVERQFTWAMPCWALAIGRSMDLWLDWWGKKDHVIV